MCLNQLIFTGSWFIQISLNPSLSSVSFIFEIQGELYSPMRITPMRITPMRITPMRITHMRITPMRITPMRITPICFFPDAPLSIIFHDSWRLGSAFNGGSLVFLERLLE